MKKTLLATAIAGAMAASGAQAATVYNQDGTQVDLYGNIQMGWRSVETAQGDGSVESEDDIFDNGTTLGIAAEHQVYDGLTGYLKLEIDDFAADEMKAFDDTGDSGDTAYAGLKGNFGDVRLGSYDVLINDWIQDPVDGAWYDGVSESSDFVTGVHGDREGDQLRYISPSFNGLQFAVGTQYKGDAETESNYQSGGVAVEGDNASFFGGVKYTSGSLTMAAVYDDLGSYDGKATDLVTGTTTDFDAGEAYGLNAQFAATDELTLAAKIERFDGTEDTAAVSGVETADMYAVKANYAYGMGNIYGAYQYLDGDNGSDSETFNEVMLGADYYLTPALGFFVETTMYDREDDVDDFVATGLYFAF